MYAPGTRSFKRAKPVLTLPCSSYRVFTPGPGLGGTYTFDVLPSATHLGGQLYHFEVQAAGPADGGPGVPIGDFKPLTGKLNGDADDVVRLYRFNVIARSQLTLRLTAPQSSEFDLALLEESGHQVTCACDGHGSQRLREKLPPGRYFAVVTVRDITSGSFTLVRELRTITKAAITFGGHVHEDVVPGDAATLRFAVGPGANGPALMEIDRYDPLNGWQYYMQVHLHVRNGAGTYAFTAPSIGEWRASGAFLGTRRFSPSTAPTYASVFVARPLPKPKPHKPPSTAPSPGATTTTSTSTSQTSTSPPSESRVSRSRSRCRRRIPDIDVADGHHHDATGADVHVAAPGNANARRWRRRSRAGAIVGWRRRRARSGSASRRRPRRPHLGDRHVRPPPGALSARRCGRVHPPAVGERRQGMSRSRSGRGRRRLRCRCVTATVWSLDLIRPSLAGEPAHARHPASMRVETESGADPRRRNRDGHAFGAFGVFL